MSFDPRGMTTWPFDFVSRVVVALTSSPGLALRESTGRESCAFISVPCASSACDCLAWTAVDDESLCVAVAPVLSALTEVFCCALLCVCACAGDSPWARETPLAASIRHARNWRPFMARHSSAMYSPHPILVTTRG